MTKRFSLLICLLIALAGRSQEVVSTQGDYYSNANGSVSYTIGEVVIATGTDGTNDLTQGFQQTNWNFVNVEDYDSEYAVSIYPNPTQDQLNISSSEYEQVQYSLIDKSGRIVRTGRMISGLTTIDVNGLAPGNYSLLLIKNDRKLKNYNLVKIN